MIDKLRLKWHALFGRRPCTACKRMTTEDATKGFLCVYCVVDGLAVRIARPRIPYEIWDALEGLMQHKELIELAGGEDDVEIAQFVIDTYKPTKLE